MLYQAAGSTAAILYSRARLMHIITVYREANAERVLWAHILTACIFCIVYPVPRLCVNSKSLFVHFAQKMNKIISFVVGK